MRPLLFALSAVTAAAALYLGTAARGPFSDYPVAELDRLERWHYAMRISVGGEVGKVHDLLRRERARRALFPAALVFALFGVAGAALFGGAKVRRTSVSSSAGTLGATATEAAPRTRGAASPPPAVEPALAAIALELGKGSPMRREL